MDDRPRKPPTVVGRAPNHGAQQWTASAGLWHLHLVKAMAVTVSIGVRDLERAVSWYQAALGLGEPDLVPAEGLIEFDLGAFWLQLAQAPTRSGTSGIGVNISVEDVRALQAQLRSLRLDVSDVQHFEGAVDYCELTDPDGNKIGLVTELG